MYKNIPSDIRLYHLDDALFRLHKNGAEKSDFGMDNTGALLEGGFGLYSSVNLKKKIGPVKTEYYRIGLFRQGSATLQVGLERFQVLRNSMVFGFPGQIFCFEAPSPDLFNYYCLFNSEFLLRSPDLNAIVGYSPFYSYAGTQCFSLTEAEGLAVEQLFLNMNAEVKANLPGAGQAVRSMLQLLLIRANRSYGHTLFAAGPAHDGNTLLFNRFVKLVSQHVRTRRKVADYAGLLHVTADHLNRVAKAQTGKTAHEHIDAMLLLEARALLRHSSGSVAEVAYQLEFSDPSHFNKFFRKQAGITPLQYRNGSD